LVEGQTIVPGAEDLWADPSFFLHSLDVQADRAIFFPTTRGLLSEAAFVDGRSQIATGAPVPARLSELLTRDQGVAPSPDRFIFHLSFCGSTLLARLLDRAGVSLVLKEPNCLVDLATWKTLMIRAGKLDRRFGGALQFSRSILRRRWSEDETITIKPSSWVNNLLDELTADPGRILPLFVTMERSAFVRAVFRGGTDRLAFIAQLAWHLASDVPDGDRLLQEAVDAAGDPLGRAANLAVLVHHLQLSLFDKALKRGAWHSDHVIDFDEVTTAPYDAAVRASHVLRLGLSPQQIEFAVERCARNHSKAPDIGFTLARRRSEDEAVDAHHQATMTAAVAWGDQVLGPQRLKSVASVDLLC